MEFGMILIKLISGFLALVICMKLTGAKGVSNLTPIDFIWSILLSEIVGNGLYDEKVKWYYVLLTLLIWCLLKFLFDKIMYKSDRLERMITGDRDQIILDGELDEKEMQDNRLDLRELCHALRKQGIFSLDEIDQAFLEKDGTITVQKKTEYETATKGDLYQTIEKPDA